MAKKTQSKGITLIELVMVIVIIGVLAGVSSGYIKGTIDLWNFLRFRNEDVAIQRMALSRMTSEIRQIKDGVSVTTANSSQFAFTDINSNAINYYVSGNNLMRQFNAGTAQILAGGVTSGGLVFTYYNSGNSVIANPIVAPSKTDIYMIKISLTIQSWSGDQAKTLITQVYPRNITN